MKSLLLNLLLVLFGFSFLTPSLAQTTDSIRTGRPGQSISPYVVGQSVFQIESGLDHAWSQGAQDQTTGLSSNFVRFGVLENFELSGLINFQKDDYSNVNQADTSGLSELQLGFRFNIISEPSAWLPALGVQTSFSVPAVQRAYLSDYTAPVIILAAHHSLTSSLDLTNNIGLSYDGDTPTTKYTYASGVSTSLTENWGTFLEIYGFFKDDYGNVYVETGLSYLMSKDFQWDLSGGWGNNHGVSEGFVSLGLSWRSAN